MSRCKNHPQGMDFFNGTASCLECGDMVYEQLKLCERCSKYLDQCEICCEAADETDINPALVGAFSSPEAVNARKLARVARELQSQTYAKSLGDTYQSLVEPSRVKLTEAIKPLREKLTADIAADPACQAAQAEFEAARLLPSGKDSGQLMNKACLALRAASLSYEKQFQSAQEPLIAAHKAEIAPFETVHMAIWDALQKSTQAIIDEAEATLTRVIADARKKKR
ncbi:MAG: hypothetical protein KGS72_21885 [Cyanobacteria bacterium REEB67]|nr:hypothetical protein [Cyanobacteria bacterium REEB67]